MQPRLFTMFTASAILALAVAGCTPRSPERVISPIPSSAPPEVVTELVVPGTSENVFPLQRKRIDFSSYNPIFRFSAEIPSEWGTEHVKNISSLNIYNPDDPAESTRDKSQIFIRFFEADAFLTLSTVNIFERRETSVKGHDAVAYEIEKKSGVANFPSQPSWRNKRHMLTDIRFAATSPSLFFVIAYNPSLPRGTYDTFLQSIRFHNDQASFVSPLDRARERISLKPFGINVSPGNSPIVPERFSGYHTAVDLEVFESERDQPVPVRAFCGGEIAQKKESSGYGGVVVQSCMIDDQLVTVVYGHLLLPSVTDRAGSYVAPGDRIGELGRGFTEDTDGERKHLHFGIYKGTGIDIRGYVSEQSQLSQWLNPQEYL